MQHPRSRIVTLAALSVLAVSTLLGIGCARSPAAGSNLRLTPEEERQKLLLDDSDQARALAAMRSVAQGHTPTHRIAPAAEGMRWSDVQDAVRLACAMEGVEMTVVRTVVMMAVRDGKMEPYACCFRLRTIEDWPGELTVCRVDGPDVYMADGWIGRFPEERKCIERKERLLSALRQTMRALGKKDGLIEKEPR